MAEKKKKVPAPKKSKSNDVLYVRVSPDNKAFLVQAAAKDGRTVSVYVDRLITELRK